MEGDQLTDAQRRAVMILNRQILDPRVLLKNCLLDYGRHEVKPKYDLGGLDLLPTEIRCAILENIDVKTLLVFRAVNKRAMATVDEVPCFKKIMINAPNTVRMAIGIRTAHTFTIKQLHDKLCQETCDSGCGRPAPYIDVCMLSRRCLWTGGACDRSMGPQTAYELSFLFPWERDPAESDLVYQIQPDDVPSFRAIPERYGHNLFRVDGISPKDADIIFYDVALAERFFVEKCGSKPLRDDKGSRHRLDSTWTYSAVLAPWLSIKGKHAVHGSFCEKCLAAESRRRLFEGLFGIGASERNVSFMAFGPSEWLVKHLEEAHGDGN
ncbi:hypothetical protein BKA63DRAFT_609002 [Paraphoma chrysanthemicola]|nr:hypothetical protein BKA63DRAFT_609002 [Paraphoma chrysanthemicola]